MKRTMRFAIAAVLLTFFVASFVGEVQARPGWVSVKYKSAKLIIQKGKKSTDKNYLRLELTFGITNNSKSGDIMTAIYNKKVSWSGRLVDVYDMGTEYPVGYSGNFPNPNKGEWYPGQTYDYKTSVPLGLVIKESAISKTRGSWNRGSWKNLNEALVKKWAFKMSKFFLDFQVRSKR